MLCFWPLPHKNSLLIEADRDVHVYPNIFTLLTTRCTLPVSSCEAERLFSGLRRIKTFARSSMSIVVRELAGLAIIHLHNDLDIDEGKIYTLTYLQSVIAVTNAFCR